MKCKQTNFHFKESRSDEVGLSQQDAQRQTEAKNFMLQAYQPLIFDEVSSSLKLLVVIIRYFNP